MSDIEMMELRQRTLAMTDDEIQVVVRALPVDAMNTEIMRRYAEKEIAFMSLEEIRRRLKEEYAI